MEPDISRLLEQLNGEDPIDELERPREVSPEPDRPLVAVGANASSLVREPTADERAQGIIGFYHLYGKEIPYIVGRRPVLEPLGAMDLKQGRDLGPGQEVGLEAGDYGTAGYDEESFFQGLDS
jgi:hypothetical protein